MKVCIAEKPSVAKEIAAIIGADSKRNGFYEGNGYQVTWTFGHFCTLLPPEDYHSHWKFWDLNSLPMLPEKFETKLMDDGGVQKQFAVIQELLNKAESVINCGDAGQEGELIQRWVLNEAKFQGKVERLWISSLTKEAIKEGFSKLMPAEEFDTLYYAGISRAIGDWLLGMNATRLFTLKYGEDKQVLSIGRVQTPTLAMLVNRHKEVVDFKPQPYWELETLYRDTVFKYVDGRFEKKEKGEALLSAVQNELLLVTDVERKEGKEKAPSLFDLTGLQVYCNTKFGFTAENTLKMVQGLYEKKVVTYPRVDTTFLPNDMYPKVPGILKGLHSYQQFTEPLAGKKLPKPAKVFNDKKVTDHHAIIPTGEQVPLGADEQKVYDIICRRFIAVFYPDCKVAKTKVTAQVLEHGFNASGKEVLEEGWRVLFASDGKQKSDDDGEGILPEFKKDEEGPHNPILAEKTTKAPNQFTEASLLRAMETAGKQVEDDELRDLMKANGIGRPSTRAAIIETLFKRKYAERKKKLIVPTALGIQLIDTIHNKMLTSAELTGQWEKKLKEIEDGSFGPGQFVNNMKRMVDDLVVEVRRDSGFKLKPLSVPLDQPKKSKPTAGISGKSCPKCDAGSLLKGKSSYGCSKWSEGCSFRLPFEFKGKKLTEKQWLRVLEKGASTKLKGFVVDGQKVEGVVKLDEHHEVQLEQGKVKTAEKPEASPNKDASAMPACPKCKMGQLVKGNSAYGCNEWKNGCDFRFSFADIKAQAKGRKLTRELVLEILKSGNT